MGPRSWVRGCEGTREEGSGLGEGFGPQARGMAGLRLEGGAGARCSGAGLQREVTEGRGWSSILSVTSLDSRRRADSGL